MYIFGGIDGTGPVSDATYQKDFANSFVNRISIDFRWSNSSYARGPTAEGSTTARKARDLYSWVATKRAGSRHDIVLSGYSRGGAAVIETARMLGESGIPVAYLFLFDAVDMTWTVNADLIPKNVKVCFHAIRHPASRSRTSWGNAGTSAEDASKTRLVTKHFNCTHGGMGGVPWTKAGGRGVINEAHTPRDNLGWRAAVATNPVANLADTLHELASDTTITVEQDARVSAEVGKWMWDHLRTLPANLPAALERRTAVG